MAKKRMSDAEFDRQFAEAAERGRRRAEGPRAVAAFYDEDDDAIVVEFNTKGTVEIPRALLDELKGAGRDDLAQVELSPQGTALHWESLDVDVSVAGAVALAIGPRSLMSAMGSVGGRATSEAKAAAARANGMKGGRPPASPSGWSKSTVTGKYVNSGSKRGGPSGGARGGSKGGSSKSGPKGR